MSQEIILWDKVHEIIIEEIESSHKKCDNIQKGGHSEKDKR